MARGFSTITRAIRTMTLETRPWVPRYFDIGVNFSDPMFQGFYNHSSTPKHPPDLSDVIARAHLFNVKKMLVTASTIEESESHFLLCDKFPNDFYSTVGVHPCTVAEEFYTKASDEGYTEQESDECPTKLNKLKQLVEDGVKRGSVKAFGEIGLDYDRLHYSSKNQQLTMFRKQLEVIASLKHLQLPLFLHMRNACDDFIGVLKPFIDDGSILKGNGVVHSFTGTTEELNKLLELGFYIGINGCSLKTEENLEVAKRIPTDRLMIETDAPWCEIRKSHSGYKFLTSYPNKYYPEIEIPQVQQLSLEPEPSDETPNKKKNPKKNPPKKNPAIKLDDFIPFPSIKKENYEKHMNAVNDLKAQGTIEDGSGIGVLAPPLIKSRNEPVHVGFVAEIMCKLHGLESDSDIETFIDTVYENSCKVFKI